MYGKGFTAAGSGTAALAYTGFNTAWTILAGVMLLLAGVALVKLVPRKGQS